MITDAQGRVLIEKRQGRGLYEGMYQLPTTAWPDDPNALPAATGKKALTMAGLTGLPAKNSIGQLGQVRHVLTHFDFYLDVHALHVSAAVARKLTVINDRRWVAWSDLKDYGIPQVMKKALSLVRPVARRG